MPDVRAASSDATGRPGSAGAWLDSTLLLGAGVVLLALGIGRYPLWDPGEGRSAQVAREMAAAGRWLVPVLYGAPYEHKPAPFFDLLRAFQAVLGPGEVALRMPSVLATLGTLLLLHRFAVARVTRVAAALAAVVFLTSPEVIALGRFCNCDAALSFFVTAAVVAWLGWLDSPRARFPWQAYVAMGLGVLIKGPVAIVLPVLIAAGCAWRRGVLGAALAQARPLRGAVVVAALVGPWIVPAAIADPHYVKTFLLHHNVERYLSSHFAHVHGVLFYVPAILGGMFPWSLLLPAAALADPPQGVASDAAIWSGTIIAFFTLGQAKLATYVLPAFPALALFLAIALHGLAVAPRARVGRLLDGAVVLWAGILLVLPVGALGYLLAAQRGIWHVAVWTLPLPLLAWLGARRLHAATPRPLAICVVFAATNAVVLLLFYQGAAPVISRVASDANIASFARRAAPDAPIVGFRIQPASLSYYSDKTVARTQEVEDIRAAAGRGPLLIVTRRRHVASLRAAGIPLYEWLDSSRHLLYATVPAS